MVRRRLDDAVREMQGELISGDPTLEWESACLDSREARPGELFFAIAGERTDGHRFVGQALSSGVAAAVVDQRQLEVDGPLIRVDDPYRALHRLTRWVRSQVPEHLVAVTGSSGKTTTKELLAAMLGRRFRTAANPGNLNNLYGFPLALLGIPDDTEWMVAEMGMSTPEELRQLSLLGRPDIAIFTNVREAHLEVFGSLTAIAEAKAELLAGLAPDGLVIANASDPYVRRIGLRHSGEVVWYGSSEADVQAHDVRTAPGDVTGSRFVLQAGGESVEIELPLHGLYNVENFLAAAACAQHLGVPLSEIAAAVEAIEPQAKRGIVHRLAEKIIVVDDTYNANPDAVARALESGIELSGERHWTVLGDMLELGDAGSELHRQVGRHAAALGYSPIVGVGQLARELVEAAHAEGAATEWFEDADVASGPVAEELRAGDLLLVKGSRGIGLEVVVDRILEEAG